MQRSKKDRGRQVGKGRVGAEITARIPTEQQARIAAGLAELLEEDRLRSLSFLAPACRDGQHSKYLSVALIPYRFADHFTGPVAVAAHFPLCNFASERKRVIPATFAFAEAAVKQLRLFCCSHLISESSEKVRRAKAFLTAASARSTFSRPQMANESCARCKSRNA